MTTPSVICEPFPNVRLPRQRVFVFRSSFVYLFIVCLFCFFTFLDASAALHVHLSSETAECLLASPLKPDLVNALEHLLRQRLNATHSNTLSLQHQHSSGARSLAIPHQTPHTQSFLPRSRRPDKQIHQKNHRIMCSLPVRTISLDNTASSAGALILHVRLSRSSPLLPST